MYNQEPYNSNGVFVWLIDWLVFHPNFCSISAILLCYFVYTKNVYYIPKYFMKTKAIFFYFALNEIVHLQNIFFYFISAMMSFLSWWVHILRTIREQHHHKLGWNTNQSINQTKTPFELYGSWLYIYKHHECLSWCQ
jgi:hypothetical protein